MAKNQMAQLIAENQRLKKEIALLHAERPFQIAFARQMTADFFCCALKRAFGFGPKRQKQLHKVFMGVSDEYEDLVETDYKSDPDLWYLQGKLDEEVKACFGPYFVPWPGRYHEEGYPEILKGGED